MILPIVAFGSNILRTKCKNITPEYHKLDKLLSDMWETMYGASGVGLAAPQINKPIRLFLIDTTPFIDDNDKSDYKPVKKVFINPTIINQTGEECVFNEGCLSIPELREDVIRKPIIKVEYYDENFVKYTELFEGLTARVIQHEYDHINGVLFIDRISLLRRKMIKSKLNDISKGKVHTSYRMKY